jgi:hypothetical protein
MYRMLGSVLCCGVGFISVCKGRTSRGLCWRNTNQSESKQKRQDSIDVVLVLFFVTMKNLRGWLNVLKSVCFVFTTMRRRLVFFDCCGVVWVKTKAVGNSTQKLRTDRKNKQCGRCTTNEFIKDRCVFQVVKFTNSLPSQAKLAWTKFGFWKTKKKRYVRCLACC